MKKEEMPTKDPRDKQLREHLIFLLDGGGAHAKFSNIVSDMPEKLRGLKPEGLPHSAWMLLEHLRIAQRDILEFSRNPKHESPEWPEGYWPEAEAPPSAARLEQQHQEIPRGFEGVEDLVKNPKIDLFAKIPWGDGQTILREALLIADHNAYHLGQLVDVRRLLGVWPE